VSKNELKEGLLKLFNLSMTENDINIIMDTFELNNEGDITYDVFCKRMIIDSKSWVDPKFMVDKATFMQFIYEE